ncbi:DUF4350 domain-containing protein [Neobacillus jeddahensis]|uniref:DUF4350 domain-containing protein n=1 Tax=Neobacillus jeddahensis TaxID=1461580 RepID=UPI00058FEC4B|nr:DUF4350 domain-containing protein [Neobacillus jeddahensis]
MKSTKPWVLLAVLLVLLLLVSYISFSPKAQTYPDYALESPSPTGLKAIYTYLEKEMDVTVWSKSPDMLPNGGKKLLMMVEPPENMKNEEMQRYNTFMKQGNTILLLADNPKGRFAVETFSNENMVAANLYDNNNIVVKAQLNSKYRLKSLKQDKVLIHDNLGAIALQRTFGKGQLIVAVTPEWLTNKQILKFDHLSKLLDFIDDGNSTTIMFDEYIHGESNVSNLFMVYPKWFLFLLLQGIFFTLIWFWYKGKRFGPIFLAREDSVRFSDEGIQAIAAWYIKGKRYQESLRIQADYVKLLLQEHWQIPYRKEWIELASTFEKKRVQLPANEIGPLLTGLSTVLEKKVLTKQEYLLWSRKLDQLRKEVEA